MRTVAWLTAGMLMTLVLGQEAQVSAGYIDAVLADNPLAYWRLNETSGSSAADASINGQHASYGATHAGTAGPRPSDGFLGFESGNVALAASDSEVTTTSGFLPTGNSARTIEGWFHGGAGTQTFFHYGVHANGQRVSVTANGNELAVAVNGHNFGTTFAQPLSGWRHFAITLPQGGNSAAWELHLDGKPLNAGTLAGGPRTVNTQDSAASIGLSGQGGAVDEVAVYDQRLSSAQIFNHYAAATGSETRAFEFQRGAALPELSVASYQGVSDVRLNPVVSGGSAGNDNLFVGDSGNGVDNRSLLRFDLSALNGYVPVEPAKLSLRVQGINTAPDANDFFDLYVVHPSNAGWAESSASWDGATGTAPWLDASGSGDFPGLGAAGEGYELVPIDSLNLADYSVGQYLNFEIPAHVISDMIHNPHAGLLLRTRDEDNPARLYFYSSEDGILNSPALTVYAQAVPEPSMVALLAGLLLVGAPLARRRMR